ncbi:DnaJ domain-containing protein [Protomyces lactucae-debilis]|uniref:DnaJ domain-containing protein n=1 Tax=Protomyces lactucae-debilis TaxID=2754530 RepID=A0A1Y2FQH0_PROLT|nr:DnaJ domain-containing protein [Protomyces lactucae-debilis]ORY86252.1 DnaJ domain-containing protein [Protomyces lactucae-debilis]
MEQLRLTAGDEAEMAAAGMSEKEKSLRKEGKRKGGLTKEQRAELHAYEQERLKIREERITALEKKLIERISVWTESERSPETTSAFQMKCKYEAENLKMESFGVELLHAIGGVYVQKAELALKSQKFMGSFFGKMKEKGGIVKDTWNTLSVAVDAQMTAERVARMEEKGGDEWNEEIKREMEEEMTGKVLAASWAGTKYEIGGVLREVCDRVLAKTLPKEKRIQRAQAMIIMGNVFLGVQPEEGDEGRVFETLVANAHKKKHKKKETKPKPATTVPAEKTV